MGELDAESPLARSFLITSGTLLNKVAARKEKKKRQRRQPESVEKKSIFSSAGFFGGGWFEYLWVPNKGAYHGAFRVEENHNMRKTPLLFKAVFSRGAVWVVISVRIVCSRVDSGDLLWQEIVGLMSSLLTPQQSRFNPHLTVRGVIMDRCLAGYCVGRLVWSVQCVWDKVEVLRGHQWSLRMLLAEQRERSLWRWPSNKDSQRNISSNRTRSEVPIIPLIALWCFTPIVVERMCLVSGFIMNSTECILSYDGWALKEARKLLTIEDIVPENSISSHLIIGCIVQFFTIKVFIFKFLFKLPRVIVCCEDDFKLCLHYFSLCGGFLLM